MKARSLSVGLVGENDANRLAITRELSGPEVGVLRDYYLQFEIQDLVSARHDAVIVDLDHDLERALELVRGLTAAKVPTVMVYSGHGEPDMMKRALQAGAHEFLVLPLGPGIFAGALIRAMARRPAIAVTEESGELFVFFGVKGGVGVTTIASNFALLLARESGKSTLLIDFDLPLGDIALNLGLTGKYSTLDALENVTRLDANFLSSLLQPFGENVWVLAAPGHFINMEFQSKSIDKLVSVALEHFDYVVVDSGSRLNFIETNLYRLAGTIFMVTQTGIPELRNANRMMGQFPTVGHPRLQIVINRHAASFHSLDEETVEKVLTRPVDWKIPNDYGTAIRMQYSASPLAFEDTPISRTIRKMARSICGASEPLEGLVPVERKRGLFGMFR
jgi:pilus assembly protein CpaE